MSTLFENYITGDTNNDDMWDNFWRGQTFAPVTSHTITSIKLLMYRLGSPVI